jgi:UDP-glucose 4-epimerase
VPVVRESCPRARVIAMVRRARAARFGPGIEIVAGDLRAARVWRKLPETVTHLIHLAAAIPRETARADPADVILDNLAPLARLIAESARWEALRHVVYASSVSVYAPTVERLRESSLTRPPAAYGAAKLAGEALLQVLTARGIAVAALRYSSLYGTGQYPGTVLPLMVDRARRGLPLHVFNAARVQDFVHVDDAARATWLACEREARGAFNVGTGRSIAMMGLARAIVRIFDRHGTSHIVVDGGPSGDAGVRMDVGRARRELGYRPVFSLDAGLRRLNAEKAADLA